MDKTRDLYIAHIIERHPGIQFREIMRSTGFKNGVLSHYLAKLERSGAVRAIRGPRQTRFYPPGIPGADHAIIKNLRRSTPRRILRSLMLNPGGLEFSRIVQQSSRAPSTVSLYLTQLAAEGIVHSVPGGKRRTYRISDMHAVGRLIRHYHPGMLDRPASGLEDIINSL